MATHTLSIPGWRPAYLNELLSVHWRVKHRRKQADADVVRAAMMEQGVPAAAGKRRVGVTIWLARRKRECDPDNVWKSLLDALKRAGALVDDSRRWCECGDVEFGRDPLGVGRTDITLEDIP